ncbi:endospore germination permease [Bacillus sp. DNRA2]|uniref:GerAB/ArcD/ProY family transporter n=1 Tax=Bacillus sp. DNRA2 TaxID=2723053 RepID=UPI00145D8987|nr:endospore germination permease [Bacillus sp. DNRA2]NMD69055.1 endospore germination permease [Bacillus sp. DNRA2]
MIQVQTESISRVQFFVLLILFNIGSTLILNIGQEAKNNAWLAILLASFGGVLILIFHFRMMDLYPQMHLYQILDSGFGKIIGRMIGSSYIFYFFLSAGLSVRNIGELMVNTILSRTPIEIFLITMVLTSAYILYLGVEVLGRSAEIFIPYCIAFLVFIGLSLLVSGQMRIRYLEPFLGDGMGPVLLAIFPYHITLPFGELVAFMVLIPKMAAQKKMMKWGMIAVIASGVILCCSSLVQIMTLGPLKERANFPLLSASNEISLLNFIERVDLLVVFIMLLGMIVRSTIFFYAGLKGLEHIFSIPYRSMLLPLAILVALSGLLIGETFIEYKNFGKKLSYAMLLFHFFFPILLFVRGYWVRHKKGETKSEVF